ncbi:MAG TPA: FlgD immunoglobulin-like domain containing protein, partial [Thermoleophilaceae bacterium]
MIRLATPLFALLVAATVGAFFVTQRLKSGQPVVKRLALQRYFSPNGDKRKDRARVAFDLPKGDRVTVDVVTRGNDRVRRMVDDRELARGEHAFSWNGRADDGTVPPDGTYYVRVTLRRQGRAATGVRGIELITRPPHPRIVRVAPPRISARRPRPVTIRFQGPSVVRPEFGIWRTDARPAVRVATVTALRGQHSVTWDGRIGTGRAPPGSYAVSVTVQNRALVEGSSPRRLPPTRAGAAPETGFSIEPVLASGPLEPVLASGTVRVAVRNGAHRFRWSVRRVGAGRPLRRGRGAGAALAFRLPPRAPTGVYLVT